MGAATRIRIGVTLISTVAIIYVTFIAYSNGNEQAEIQSRVLSPRNCEVQEGVGLKQLIGNVSYRSESLLPSDDHNITIISREFFEYLASQLRNTLYPGVEMYTRYAMAQSRLEPLVGIEPLRSDFGDVINDVTGFRYLMRVPPCRESNHTAGVFVAIVSATKYFQKRESIRNTWLSDMLVMTENKKMDLIGHAFLLGRTSNKEDDERIRKERDEFDDILQTDVKDDYYNLTPKVVGLFSWLKTNCYRAKFVLKVDDDVYVNVRNLINVIESLDSAKKSTYGSFSNGLTLRDGKWAIGYESWPWTRFPVYLSGAAVLFSGETIGPLLEAAQMTPYMPFDDTYLTGLCAEKANISVYVNKRMLLLGVEKEPSPCTVYNTVTWSTGSKEHLYKSHLETERFYRNETQCVIPNKHGVNETFDRDMPVTFQFIDIDKFSRSDNLVSGK